MADKEQPQPGEVWGYPDKPGWWAFIEDAADDSATLVAFGLAERTVVERESIATSELQRIYPPPARDDQPITAEWLDACGVFRKAIGSSMAVYQVGGVELAFTSGKPLRVHAAGQRWPMVRTRQDLRDLLRLMGAEPMKEAKE